MKSLKYFIILFPFFLIFLQSKGQHFFKRSSFGAQFHYGSFMTSEPKAAYVKDSYSYFGEFSFQQPAIKAARPNQPVPYWGTALFFGETGSKKYMGKMAGAFSFINLPLIKYRSFKSNIRLGAGLGWIEKPYHKVTNHKNVVLGTPINGFGNVLWQNEWAVSKKLLINTGLSFSHLSNGSSTLPNMGLNIPAFSVGTRYGITNDTGKTKIQRRGSKQWNLTAFASTGVKQVPWIESKRYLASTANIEIAKDISYRSSIGGGVFLFHDPSFIIDINLENQDQIKLERDVKKLQAGIFATYGFNIGKFTLPLQVGLPIINSKAHSALFQQFGLRYRINKSIQATLLLKSFGGKADVIHAGLGYKIF